MIASFHGDVSFRVVTIRLFTIVLIKSMRPLFDDLSYFPLAIINVFVGVFGVVVVVVVVVVISILCFVPFFSSSSTPSPSPFLAIAK